MELTGAAHEATARAARDAYGRLLALLAAADGDIAAAEDALADAFERALRSWASDGVPRKPEAWLLTTARNRQRDRWKSASARRDTPLDPRKHDRGIVDRIDPDAIGDRRLELMLVCAHPAINGAVHTPLMLNTVLGFTAQQIGAAFAVPTATMATRLVRAKKRIKTLRVPFAVPDRAVLPTRMGAVLEAVYGAFAVEWTTAEPGAGIAFGDVLPLAEILTELAPHDPEAHGLAALVELAAARLPAGRDAAGRFVPLDEQDPARWDVRLIERAHGHLRAAYDRRTLGRFQLEAAIQAAHCARITGAAVDWMRLRRLHEGLDTLAPSIGNTVALAAVRGRTDGPESGLALLDEIADDTARFQPAWATRAELLAAAGRADEAIAAYDGAIALTEGDAHRTFLVAKRDGLIARRHGPS